jgi:transcriptional regulator
MMEQNPWALLVSQGPDGPLATNLPMLIEQGKPQGGDLVLVSHLAQANPHYIALRQSSSPVLVIFEGPWSYVTASWYPQRQMPSKYYYTAVHCYGSIEFQDEAALERSLEDLVQRMEAGYAGGWKTSEIPRSEITRRLAAIAGFRVKVSRVEAKFKLGQRPAGSVLIRSGTSRSSAGAPIFRDLLSSVMEEPGSLEIENQNLTAAPKNARAFFAPTVEFEYGATAWWTTEVSAGTGDAVRLGNLHRLPLGEPLPPPPARLLDQPRDLPRIRGREQG